MATAAGFPDKKVIAEFTAKMPLEVEAVRFMTDKPFIFTSGRASPVYADCRRLILFPGVRGESRRLTLDLARPAQAGEARAQ